MVGKEFAAFPSHIKRRRSPEENREELQSRAPIPRVPQMSQSIPGKPVFPALPRLSSRGSTHTTVARGTALWESLVGKPLAKASRESHRSVDTREEARESRPHPEEPRFRLLAREEGSFPCVVGKVFLAFPSHLKSRRSPQERREDLQYKAPFPESPRFSVHSRETCFPCTALTFKPRMDSHRDGTLDSPVGKPRGKASWESLEGKPQIP